MERLLQDIQLQTELMRKRSQEAKLEGKKYYDWKAATNVKFYVGQRVHLAKRIQKEGRGQKWRKRYTGPLRIVKRLTETTFKLRSIYDQQPKTYTVHCNRMKHAYEADTIVTAQRRQRRTRGDQDSGEEVRWSDLTTSTGESCSDSSQQGEDAGKKGRSVRARRKLGPTPAQDKPQQRARDGASPARPTPAPAVPSAGSGARSDRESTESGPKEPPAPPQPKSRANPRYNFRPLK
jgi:hypothetical protein